SWIGGDRDGNPSVTSNFTWQTLKMHRALVLKKYTESLKELRNKLSFSTNIINVSDELIESIEQDREHIQLKSEDIWRISTEPYRIKLSYMIEKIHNTGQSKQSNPRAKYQSADEFIEELYMLDRSLREHYAD